MDEYNITWKDCRTAIVGLGILVLWAVASLTQHHKVDHKDIYKPVSIQFLQEAYARDNIMYFNNELPQHPVIKNDLDNVLVIAISWTKENQATIEFNPEYNKSQTQAELTELHEMCHISLPRGTGHSYKWESCMHRLATEGAFDLLW